MTEYVPKPDVEGINSPARETPLKDVGILLSGFLAVVLVVYLFVISVSDWALTRMSLQTELSWFGKVFDVADFSKVNPPDFDAFIERLRHEVDFPFQVRILCSKEVNAIALPGGAILVTTGLLEKMETENGLTFVLGHELGHFVHRDHLRGLGRQVVFMFGAAAFGFNWSELTAFNQLVARAYDRTQESRADAFGLDLLQKEFGHTWGADELFRVLAKEETLLTKTLTRFSGTHPTSDARLNSIRKTQMGAAPELHDVHGRIGDWIASAECKNL